MVELRPYRSDDLDALYHICLVTGDSGRDASPLHNHPKLIGHLYAAPYAVIEPDQVLVAEDNLGVAGYIVGTYDTDRFAQKLEDQWWPALRAQYAAVEDLTEADSRRVAAIIKPHRTPAELVARFPAHIHMNLLPRLRGQKVGTRLLQRWVDAARLAGVSGIHLGANAGNSGGIAFWKSGGFIEQQVVGTTAWFGMDI